MSEPVPSDAEIRALRDSVFERPIPDYVWAMVRAGWSTPENVAWLREKAARSLDHYPVRPVPA